MYCHDHKNCVVNVMSTRAVYVRAKNYIIRNGYLEPRWGEVDLTLPSILGSSLDAIIRTQGNGDLYRIYIGAQRNGAEFRLAYISPEFSHPSKEFFDPAFMSALFEFGYQQAKDGYPWADAPPGIEDE